MAAQTAKRTDLRLDQNSVPDISSGSFQMIRTPRRIRGLYAMTRIRHLVAIGHSHKEIMTALKIPERTYFRYLARVFETDRRLLIKENEAMLIVELGIFRDRLLGSYRRLVDLASSEKTPVQAKITAETNAVEISLCLLKLSLEGPAIAKDFRSILSAIETTGPRDLTH